MRPKTATFTPRIGRTIGPIANLILAGCAPSRSASDGTGAKEAAQSYFQAMSRQDWPATYAVLAGESRARFRPEQFARLTQAYRAGLGFEPATVYVTACEEHEADAIAHVTLTGKGPHRRRFKEAVTLRREANGWGVVLPASFGRGGP